MQSYFASPPKNTNLNLLDSTLVESNRRGQVLPEQAAWLKSAPWGGTGTRARVLSGMVIGVGIILFVVFFFTTRLNTDFILIAGLLIAILLAVILGPRLIRAMRESTRVREDLQSGLVRQVPGELAYENGGYKVKAGDQTLELPASNNACGLLPGLRYLCYYLESSSVLLSAEPLGSGSSGMVRGALNNILAAAHRFQIEDLEVNRNGGISSGQRNALVRQALGSGGSAVLGVIFIGAVLWPYLLQGRLPQDITSLLFPLAMALGLLIPGGLAIYRGLGDVLSGTVEVAEGTAMKSTERRSGGRSSRTVYQYNINDTKFQVPQSAYLALIDGLRYRAFYAPRSRKLLSMEVMDIPETTALGA